MQAIKLNTYHDLRLSLCNHTGVPSVARLQREEMSTTQEEGRGTGTFPTGIYGDVASSVEFANVFDLANHTVNLLTNLLETLHLSKLMANSTQI
jgi:hypothetical protein